jgi:hypothetical protein
MNALNFLKPTIIQRPIALMPVWHQANDALFNDPVPGLSGRV